jgi:hypothetical protein
MAWTDDGANLALGHYDGSVSIRDKAGGERLRLECGTSPVWSLTWSSQVRLAERQAAAAAAAAACLSAGM